MRFSESSQYYGVLTLCINKTSISLKRYIYRFVSERKAHQVVIDHEQTRFLSTVFLYSEFKSKNIYSEVNFWGKNVRGYFILFYFFAGTLIIFADRGKNRKNRKN